jgi:hypothetical protein
MVSLTAALLLVVMALETLNVGPKWHSSMTTYTLTCYATRICTDTTGSRNHAVSLK